MTVAQLKQHMDRRFDHLERTKADKSDLRRFVTRSDLRRGLRRFATKDDLKRFATKDDLKRFATKDDLKRFATKDDLKRYAKQADMERGFARLDAKIDSVMAVVLSIRDTLDRVADEHDRRISDLERHVFGQGRLFPEA